LLRLGGTRHRTERNKCKYRFTPVHRFRASILEGDVPAFGIPALAQSLRKAAMKRKARC
jgi:hypothetical protein